MGRAKIDRTGEENINNFGSKIIISKYNNRYDIDVYFPEYNWVAKNKQYKDFKKGRIKCPYEPRVYDKGYIGVGKYNSCENGKKTKCYSIWKGMLRRCYDSKFKERDPAYKDCTVSEEWHNFQAFGKWYENNYYEIPGEVMCLDKDILVKGNKIYSSKTCVFVPQNINTLFVKCNKSRGDLPIGVHYSNNVYMSQCRFGDERKHLGSFNTPEEAFNAYKTAKENYIKEVADKYKEYIPKNLYDSMYNYRVEIDD